VTTIRATCPTCGDVDLPASDVTALWCSTTETPSYAFRCPACRLAVARPTSRHVLDVLVSAGVRLSVWTMPAELDERPDCPPISLDELRRFAAALAEDGWLERMVASGLDAG
jgi:hypothetical protein